jgi:hypothetical protein
VGPGEASAEGPPAARDHRLLVLLLRCGQFCPRPRRVPRPGIVAIRGSIRVRPTTPQPPCQHLCVPRPLTPQHRTRCPRRCQNCLASEGALDLRGHPTRSSLASQPPQLRRDDQSCDGAPRTMHCARLVRLPRTSASPSVTSAWRVSTKTEREHRHVCAASAAHTASMAHPRLWAVRAALVLQMRRRLSRQ